MCNTSRVQSSLEPKFDESVAPNNAMTPRTGQWSMEAKNKIKLETKPGSQYSLNIRGRLVIIIDNSSAKLSFYNWLDKKDNPYLILPLTTKYNICNFCFPSNTINQILQSQKVTVSIRMVCPCHECASGVSEFKGYGY